MALFSWSMQIIKRSAGRSVVACAAYRAGERLIDERQGVIHDYRRRSGVEHVEIVAPEGAPEWVFNRNRLWNTVEATEKRKDAQLARELRFAISREIPAEKRVEMVVDYLREAFVSKGMIADVAFHNLKASDGQEQPHCHVLLTMRPVTAEGFGRKSRHEMVPHPDGLTHADGRPVLVMDNADSWNSPAYFDQCRELWEKATNDALADSGSAARVDRRSLLERGLARLPEPALRLAYYLHDLYGCMKERFGHYQVARHYRAVEKSVEAAHVRKEAEREKNPVEQKRITQRFYDWFDRQLARLAPPSRAREGPEYSPGLER